MIRVNSGSLTGGVLTHEKRRSRKRTTVKGHPAEGAPLPVNLFSKISYPCDCDVSKWSHVTSALLCDDDSMTHKIKQNDNQDCYHQERDNDP